MWRFTAASVCVDGLALRICGLGDHADQQEQHYLSPARLLRLDNEKDIERAVVAQGSEIFGDRRIYAESSSALAVCSSNRTSCFVAGANLAWCEGSFVLLRRPGSPPLASATPAVLSLRCLWCQAAPDPLKEATPEVSSSLISNTVKRWVIFNTSFTGMLTLTSLSSPSRLRTAVKERTSSPMPELSM